MMRCAACGHTNEPDRTECSSCGARLDAALHEELAKLTFLLDELRSWEEEGRIGLRQAFRIGAKYEARRKDILKTLTSHLPEIVEEKRAAPEPKKLALERLAEQPAEEKVTPVSPEEERPKAVIPEPAPSGEPRNFRYYARRLFSDRNIRALQQIGIFVFIAGVIAFVYSQWTTWSAASKMLSMALLTVGFFSGGALLRKKTQMRWTAISVTMLGSLFIPITCFLGVRHNIFRGDPSVYWFLTSLISIAVNGFLAKALSEEVFAYFVWLAVYGLVASAANGLGASYGTLIPCLAALTALLLVLRPVVGSTEARVKDLEISFSRPLEVLVNLAAAFLFVLMLAFLLTLTNERELRAHFARCFLTALFLAAFCVFAARARNWSFYLYFACVNKIIAFIVWAAAFQPREVVWIPLLMMLGALFHIAHAVLKKLDKKWFALPYNISGTILRAAALVCAVGFSLEKSGRELETLLLTLSQFAALWTGMAFYERKAKDGFWGLGSITVWLIVLLEHLEVSRFNFPVYFLLLAALFCTIGLLVRNSRFAPLALPCLVFTHGVGISASIGVAVAFPHYITEKIACGLVNLTAAAGFTFYAGVVRRNPGWLTGIFLALSGILALILKSASVTYYHTPAYFSALASITVLLTIGGIVWRRGELVALEPFARLRPNLRHLRALLSLPSLAGSLLVAEVAFAVLLTAYVLRFDRSLKICTIWPSCLVGLLALATYCVVAALSARRAQFEYAALIFATAGYLLFLQSYRVSLSAFAGAAMLFCVFVIFLGLLFSFLKSRFMSRSALQYGLVITVAAALAMLFNHKSYQRENLLSPAFVLAVAAGCFCYFSLRRQEVFKVSPAIFTYIWSSFSVTAYSFFFMWTDVQILRDLYTMPVAASLLACAALISRGRFAITRRPLLEVSYAASLAPFLFMIGQVGEYGRLSADSHLTLIFALSAVCAYHIAAAVLVRKEWLEYGAISAGYLAYVVFLLKNGITVPKFGFASLPVVFGVFLTGQTAWRLKKRLFTRSAFLCGLVLLALSVVIPMCGESSYAEKNLPFVFGTLLIASGVMCYFALRRFIMFEKAKTPFAYSFAVLLCLGHALFLEWMSTGTPLAGLYFLQVSVLLAVVSWLLKTLRFERQWKPSCFVAFGATGVAMYLAISRSDLTAMLVFTACTVLYGFLHILSRYRFFLWAAVISFTTAYFFTLRHLEVEPIQYLLWFALLGAAQVAFSISLGRAKEVVAAPVFVVGALTSFCAMAVMVGMSKKYFTRYIDMAIVSTLIAAGTYFLCARRTRNIFFYYLSSITALGAYYLLLHKYEIRMAEFFTLPVAGLILTATGLHLRRGISVASANYGYAAGVTALLLPSLIRSFWIIHLDSCMVLYALSFGCVVAAMMFRRKVLFGAGVIAVVIETAVKLVHFIIQRRLSRAEVIMIVGILIFAFAVALELIRNRKLRERAGLTKQKLEKFFSDWT